MAWFLGNLRYVAWTALAVGVLAAQAGRPWQTMIFLVVGFAQLGVALAVSAPRRRADVRGAPQDRNPMLGVAVAASALLMVAGVLLPVLRELLGTDPLAPVEWAWCVPALLPGVVVATVRRVRRDHHAAAANAGAPDRG